MILGANPAGRIRKTFRESASVVRVETETPAPSLLAYKDTASGVVNGQVTSGNIGAIDGKRLKFDPAVADEGVYFVNTADSSEVKVTVFQRVMPSQLVFMVPTLAADAEWQLEVRVYYGEELRTGILSKLLAT